MMVRQKATLKLTKDKGDLSATLIICPALKQVKVTTILQLWPLMAPYIPVRIYNFMNIHFFINLSVGNASTQIRETEQPPGSENYISHNPKQRNGEIVQKPVGHILPLICP